MTHRKEKILGNVPTQEASFLGTNDNFLERRFKYFTDYFPAVDAPLIKTNEIIYYQHPFLEKINNTKVLIIGGGPSTLRYNWNVDDYDLICACNHFYKNPSLKEIVDFVLIQRHTKEQDIEQIRSTIGLTDFVSKNNNMKIYRRFTDRCVCVYPRYRSKIATCAKLLCIITLFGAKEIHVVGLDGRPKNIGKVQHGYYIEDKKPYFYSYQVYLNLYRDLWYYLKNKIGKQVKYVNLGYGHKYNISSKFLDDKGNWL